MPSCPRPTTEKALLAVHPHLKASAPPNILLNRSEELLLSNQWIEINEDNTRVLTAVEHRSHSPLPKIE